MSWSTEAVTAQGRETPAFFGPPERRKFAIQHVPAEAAAGAAPIVLCAPHFEEKLWAHRVLVDAARRASARGHAVFRFDVYGHGDSEGEFEDTALSDLVGDVADAWNEMAGRSGAPPVLVGLRFGATLAALAAARLGARAALWEPILDLEAWLQEMLRANLTFQIRQHGKVVKNRAQLAADLGRGQTVTLDGYGLTPRFYREAVEGSRWSETEFPGRCPGVLAVSFRGRGAPAPAPLEQAATRWASATSCERATVEEEAVWTDVRRYRTQAAAAIGATLDWIERPAAGSAR